MTPVQMACLERAKTEWVYSFSCPGLYEKARIGYGKFMHRKTWKAIKPYLVRDYIFACGAGEVVNTDGSRSCLLQYRERWKARTN